MTELLLVEDHAIVRAGLGRLLANRTDIHIQNAVTAEEALGTIKSIMPQLIVLDLNLPGLSGFEALRRLHLVAPDVPILVFSMHSEPIYAHRALVSGAKGYVSKGAPPDEILAAVDALLGGQTYVEKEIAREISEGAVKSGDYLRNLTSRDLEILRLLAEGRTLTEIARSLGVAYKTIANTCTRIREKLGVRSLAELVSVTKGLGLA
ncbi:MAG TPA: response regulator transcription factor [Rhizomicrobium sp.]|nr:response regulator transcription factor [Rhizomicrobium sp.]